MRYVKIAGELPDDIRRSYERFRYPGNTPEQERQIDRLYEPYSATLLCLTGEEILGTIRVIYKRTHWERLPCEFAHMVESLTDHAPIVRLPDGGIEIPATPDLMPVVEVGGLQVATGLPLRDRATILEALMLGAYQHHIDTRAKGSFISCEINPSIERLYTRNFQFELAAIITYHTGKNYKLFYKWNTTLIPEKHTLMAQRGEIYG